jgi:hypothetical protein
MPRRIPFQVNRRKVNLSWFAFYTEILINWGFLALALFLFSNLLLNILPPALPKAATPGSDAAGRAEG